MGLHHPESDVAHDQSLLERVDVVTQIDLADVRGRYKELYGTELYDAVKSDTSGDYQKLLLAIVGK